MAETGDLGPKVVDALARMASGPGLEDRSAAISAILSERALSAVVDSAEFAEGFEALSLAALDKASGVDQLRAIAELIRLGQSHPPLAPRATAAVSAALASEPSPVSLLSNGADRAYVGKALAVADGDWLLPYAARAVAEETTAEKARAEFMGVLIAHSSSIAALLDQISVALRSVDPGTERPADSLLKRLTRILAVLRVGIAGSRLPTGEDVGKAFERLIVHSLERFGTECTDATARGLISEVLLTTHQLVRSRFSVATDVETYAALKQVRTALAVPGWPAAVAGECDLIAETVSEAILLLAKQGITSSGLRRLLEIVTDVPHADSILESMADTHPGLSEPVRAWLARRPVAPITSGLAALKRQAELDSDDLVGECLLAERRLSRHREEARSVLVPTLQILDPANAPMLDQLLATSAQVSDAIRQLAAARGLGLLGAIGQEVAFAEKYFDSVDTAPRLRMTVIRAAVVRLRPDGKPGEAVLKGVVK